jgi:hypothetical protein
LSSEYLSLNLDANERITYPSPGRCIYCGATDAELTDEHVVPFALTGNAVIFEKASCRPCAKAISPYEQFVLRQTYGNLRVQIDAPTRRPKDRQTRIDHPFLLLDEHGRTMRKWTVQTDWNRCPVLCPSWFAPWPTIIDNKPPSAVIHGQKWHYQDQRLTAFIDKTRRFFRSPGVAYEVGKIDGAGFLRFIAKMAHGYAVATRGYDAFDWLTPGVILGSDPYVSHLVGGSGYVEPADLETGSAIKFDFGDPTPEIPFFLVRIRLFEFLGTPDQVVVVGRPKAHQICREAKAGQSLVSPTAMIQNLDTSGPQPF